MATHRIKPHQQAILDAFDAGERSLRRLAGASGYTQAGVASLLKRFGREPPNRDEAMKVLNADPEFKAKAAARMKALHADPEFKAKVSAASSARMKALHADPEFKAKAAARMKVLNADPEFKAKAAARMKVLHADPEFKAKVSAASSARMKVLNADPEFKAKAAARMKVLNADPEFKAKVHKKDPWLSALSDDERRWYRKMLSRHIAVTDARHAIDRARAKAA